MAKLNCIMLVEDEPVTNFLHKIIIQDANCTHHIVTKENGQEALEYLRNPNSITPDIIFLDINMPIMNGWEFLEEYERLEDTSKAKIVTVMLTTSLNSMDQKRANELNTVNDFKNKPLSVEILNEIIKKHF